MGEARLSRRAVLRAIALSGTAAWTAPLLSSTPVSASTQTRPRNLCKGIDGNCSIGFVWCGTCSHIGDFSYCWEILNRQGEVSTTKRVCAENRECDPDALCESANDCAKGEVCATANGCTDCGTAYGICTKKCWTGIKVADGSRPPRRRPAPRLGRTMVSA